MHTSALAACKADLYTPKAELMERYPADTVEKVIRVRDIHQRLLADPVASHRAIVLDIMQAYGVTEQCAYSDLNVVKELLPMLTEARKDFVRWKTNAMWDETYRMAKAKENVKVMESTASAMARFNNIDKEDPMAVPFDQIVNQPFIPTDNPEVLGLRRIPNLREKIREMLEKYGAESIDIEDVSYEEADLQEDLLFPEIDPAANEPAERPAD